jgi:hypothetical protein
MAQFKILHWYFKVRTEENKVVLAIIIIIIIASL